MLFRAFQNTNRKSRKTILTLLLTYGTTYWKVVVLELTLGVEVDVLRTYHFHS